SQALAVSLYYRSEGGAGRGHRRGTANEYPARHASIQFCENMSWQNERTREAGGFLQPHPARRRRGQGPKETIEAKMTKRTQTEKDSDSNARVRGVRCRATWRISSMPQVEN